jgi:predicted RNA-binding Zn-ribbon protein involved in translation (DUF1610 family)
MSMKEQAKISGFVAKYYRKNHTIPSVATIVKALGINRTAFYRVFPGGIAEVCNLIGVPVPEERLKRTKSARAAKLKLSRRYTQPELKPDEEMRRLESELRRLELEEQKKREAELRAQRKRELRREIWRKKLYLVDEVDLVSDYIEKVLPHSPIKGPLEECRKRLELEYGENLDCFDAIMTLFNDEIKETLPKYYRNGDDLLKTFDRALKMLVGKELVRPYLKNHNPFVCPVCGEEGSAFSLDSGVAVVHCFHYPYPHYWSVQCPNCGELMKKDDSSPHFLRCSRCGIVWGGKGKDAPGDFVVPVQALENGSFWVSSKRSTKYFLHSYTAPS